ncbi:hypothetical protein C8R44DRAFT_876643 [Mycena epipterygia]|nr:hypothetical protein C8R44DRAFT_876643 [Mycena epipterygia]
MHLHLYQGEPPAPDSLRRGVAVVMTLMGGVADWESDILRGRDNFWVRAKGFVENKRRGEIPRGDLIDAKAATAQAALGFSTSDWIWTPTVTVNALVGFRKDFTPPVGKALVASEILITAATHLELFVNGEYIGAGTPPAFNVFAVNASIGGSANGGMLATILLTYSDGSTDMLVTLQAIIDRTEMISFEADHSPTRLGKICFPPNDMSLSGSDVKFKRGDAQRTQPSVLPPQYQANPILISLDFATIFSNNNSQPLRSATSDEE